MSLSGVPISRPDPGSDAASRPPPVRLGSTGGRYGPTGSGPSRRPTPARLLRVSCGGRTGGSNPDRDVSRLHRLRDLSHQTPADAVEVDRVAEMFGEGSDRGLSVV